jgi:hypothetical protein
VTQYGGFASISQSNFRVALTPLSQTGHQEVILALLEKYRAVEIDEISDPRVFRLSPFRGMGQAPGVAKRFGSLSGLQRSLTELQERIYN